MDSLPTKVVVVRKKAKEEDVDTSYCIQEDNNKVTFFFITNG
jgi:hypothetical protein